MRTPKSLSFVALAWLVSCRGSCSNDAEKNAARPAATTDASAIDAAIARGPDAGIHATPSECASADPFIYLVGTPPGDRRATALFRFAPKSGETTRIGSVTCAPFSIAIDRQGVIWAPSEDHTLHTIDAATGVCQLTSFAKDQHGFEQFYVAFVADPSAKNGEILYASDEHYSHGDPAPSRGLATIDNTLKLTVTGQYDHHGPFENRPCAIVGTGDGRLFAQCTEGELWSVRRTFEGTKVPLDPIAGDKAWLNPSNARPLAFWGGSLWLFAHPCDSGDCDAGSHVTRFDVASGVAQALETRVPVVVSAATSSTCAPL